MHCSWLPAKAYNKEQYLDVIIIDTAAATQGSTMKTV